MSRDLRQINIKCDRALVIEFRKWCLEHDRTSQAVLRDPLERAMRKTISGNSRSATGDRAPMRRDRRAVSRTSASR